jgi:molecular chaperone GrpE (heat shock protein)
VKLNKIKKKEMSWYNPLNYFTGNKTPLSSQKEVKAEDALDQASDSIDSLESKRMQLLQKISKLLKEAKELKASKKDAQALECMKRKQALEKQVAFLDGQIQNLERMSLGIDSTAMAVQVAETMKTGSESMKAMTQKISVSEIETIADNLDENILDSNDLMTALSRPLGGDLIGDDPDRDELLMKELEGEGLKIIEPKKEDSDVELNMPDLPPSLIKKEEVIKN